MSGNNRRCGVPGLPCDHYVPNTGERSNDPFLLERVKEGMTMMKKIELYDTTLRDGTQGEDVSFSVEDKLRIARKLDEFGIHYIEGGWPGSNPRDLEFFRRVKGERFHHAKIAAFGSTRRAKNRVEVDPNILALWLRFLRRKYYLDWLPIPGNNTAFS